MYRSLQNKLAETKASIPEEVTHQVAAAIDVMWMQGLLPPQPTDMLSPQHPDRTTRVIGSSCASTELPADQRYPVDEIQY